MFARVITYQLAPERVEDALAAHRERVLPTLQGLAGFKGTFLLIERQSGKVMGIGLWEDEQALQASAQLASRLRTQTSQAIGVQPTAEEYEVFGQVTA